MSPPSSSIGGQALLCNLIDSFQHCHMLLSSTKVNPMPSFLLRTYCAPPGITLGFFLVRLGFLLKTVKSLIVIFLHLLMRALGYFFLTYEPSYFTTVRGGCHFYPSYPFLAHENLCVSSVIFTPPQNAPSQQNKWLSHPTSRASHRC